MQSPLDLMCWLSPETERADHLEYINNVLVAFIEDRLYRDGPGPPPVWYYRKKRSSKGTKLASIADLPRKVAEFWGENPENGQRVLHRLSITLPPRHGKSFLISEHFPIWYWMRYPDNHIAFVTYSDEFAATWGKKLRNRLLEWGPRLNMTPLNGIRQSSHHMEFLETDGEMFLVGTGGALTGKGFQLGIGDDLIKDAEEALSPAIRKQKINFYTSVYTKRKTRRPQIIPKEVLMGTRWNEDDPTGHFVYEEDGSVRDDWFEVHMPALALDDDLLGREVGEALWPTMWTEAELLKEQEDDPVWFDSQFQGAPSFGEAGQFPHMYTYDKVASRYLCEQWEEHEPAKVVDSEDCMRFATLDTAYTKNKWSDYTVYSVWDFHRPTQTLFLVDWMRDRVSADEHDAWLLLAHQKWPTVSFVGVENASHGKAMLQQLRATTPMTLRPMEPQGDKFSRALPYSIACAQGLVFFPRRHPRLHVWVQEHKTFLRATHDDMVDTGAYAWRIVKDMHQIVAAEMYSKDTTMEGKVARKFERMDRDEKMKVRRPQLLQGRMGR